MSICFNGGGDWIGGDCTGEGFNLFSDYVYSSVVAGVEFEDHLAHVLGAVYSPR